MEIERECGTEIENAVDFGKLDPIVWLFKMHGPQSLNAEEAANVLLLSRGDEELDTTNMLLKDNASANTLNHQGISPLAAAVGYPWERQGKWMWQEE